MLSLTANNIKSPVRSIRGCVEVYRASTLLNTYTYKDALQEFTIERVSDEGKFFGFGICQKVNVKLRDVDRVIDIAAKDSFKVGLDSDGENYAFKAGNYFITEVRRDENSNALTLYAYDKIYEAASHYTSELDLSTCSTFGAYITAIADFLGLDGVSYMCQDTELSTFSKAASANLEGSETLRGLLDDIAEATQTVYFINYQNKLVFRRISKTGFNLDISKNDYFSLTSKDNRRLQTICATTQLGDNYSSSTSQIGTTQYIRDNDFWTNNENTPAEVEAAIALYGDLTISQFECTWRGNYLLEVGDRIRIENKDGSYSYSYLYDDTLTYNGALQEKTKWSYKENDMESAANPTNLGDKLKQTFAIVDKANKQIDIVAGNIEEVEQQVAAIQLTTDGITASVNQVAKNNQDAIDAVNANMETLTTQVNAAITSEEVAIEVQKQLANGVDEVTTSTGFTFNEEGLKVSKSDSEISTQILDDGMKIYRNQDIVLTANNKGVDAYNLHATTYLIVGLHSRFEDYGERTGCFWIGEQGYNPTATAALSDDTNAEEENEVI